MVEQESGAASTENEHEIIVWMLVTDKGVTKLARDPNSDDDHDDFLEAVRDAVRYEHATRFELRRVRLTIPLLVAPAKDEATADAAVDVQQFDLDDGILRALHHIVAQEKAASLEEAHHVLMRAFPQGKWEVSNEPGCFSMKRVS